MRIRISDIAMLTEVPTVLVPDTTISEFILVGAVRRNHTYCCVAFAPKSHVRPPYKANRIAAMISLVGAKQRAKRESRASCNYHLAAS